MKTWITKNVSHIARVLLLLLLLSVCLSPLLTHTAVAMSEIPSDLATFTADTKWFSVDEVSLIFYYGSRFLDNLEWERCSKDIPAFDLYFENELGNRHHIRRVEENYVSEKYRFYYPDPTSGTIIYKHSERISVPKTLFAKEEGVVYFVIYGKNIAQEEETDRIVRCPIYYQIMGDKVRITRLPFSN